MARQLNSSFDDLLDDSDIVIEPVDEPTDDKTNLEIQDESSIYAFLKEHGISNPSELEFENESGEIEKFSFDSLDKEDQLNILKEITRSDYSDAEKEIISKIRSKGMTFEQLVEEQAKEKVDEYIKSNSSEKTYSIDDYSDDELYIADLKLKYSDFTDEEILKKLDIIKSDEDLFQKEVTSLRNYYKQQEDEYSESIEQQAKEHQAVLVNNIAEAVNALDGIVLDYTDPQSDSLEIDDNDREEVKAYLFNPLSDGKSQFVKDMEDPKALAELGWYKQFGQKAISETSKYWKSILVEERKELNKLKKELESYKSSKKETYKEAPKDNKTQRNGLYRDLPSHFNNVLND